MVPFQCSISVWLPAMPTAQTSLAATAATPSRTLLAPGLGLATTAHAVPFQCSTSVRLALPEKYMPTAHTSLAATAVTPKSWSDTLALALVTMDHAVPSQCSVSVWKALLGCQ